MTDARQHDVHCRSAATGVGHTSEAGEAIGDDSRSRHGDTFDEALHPLALEARDTADLRPRWLTAINCLNRHDNLPLVRATTARFTTGALTAEIGIVNLHATLVRVPMIADGHSD